MSKLDDQDRRLIQTAAQVRAQAYAPYSQFHVGAALLCGSGEIYPGVNIENASYGLTICAERSACAAAISQGLREWLAIAIVSQGGVTPCGACRQFLLEFAPPLRVLVADANNLETVRCFTLSDLLPNSFSAAGLKHVPGRLGT